MAFLVNMDVSKVYSLSLGSALVFLLTFRLCHAVWTCFYPQLKRLMIRLMLPHPSGRLSWVLPKDWGRFTLLTIYVGGTVASNGIHVSTLSEASSRAAMLCLANLVPLMICSHEVGTHLLGMSLDLFHGVHRILGVMAFLQGLAHGIIELVSTPINLHDSSTVFGILALIVFALLLLSSIFKSRIYELFIHSHRFCALGLVLTSWRHVSSKSALSTWYVIGAASVYGVTLLIQLLRMAVRNLTFSTRAECLIKEKDKNLEIVVFPARPWEVQAGERVNLSLISAGLFSIFQMHPFVIAWWDKNEVGKLESVTLLVRPRAGFTSKLAKLSGRHTAWIDGPYGPDRTLGGAAITDYGHIFMVATGIGIVAQIPHIKQLLEGCRQGTVRTRKIKLLWQLDTEGDYEDVSGWLQELVAQDSGYHFEVHIFNPSLTAYAPVTLVGKHELIKIWGGDVDWREQLVEEFKRQVGRMLITVSAKTGVRDVFRRLARNHQRVDLLELEFQPWEWKRSIWSYF